jgi:epoxyqueuosine reductase
MEDLLQELQDEAQKLGFDALGVTAAAPARRLDAYLRWIDDGRHGAMGYLARPDRIIRRQDPAVILPGIQSIISVAMGYTTAVLPREIGEDPSRGRISNYAWNVDYHDVMLPRLEELGAWLEMRRPGTRSRAYVDTGAILERDHGETGGLGFTGKNTMLIGPRTGSWFFLGELLTTLTLPLTEPAAPLPGCGSCTRCLSACPTNAFPQPYVLDARRCISYLTIELKGWIPRELRPLMGNWVYGCDICQDVCPFNRFATPAAEAAFYAENLESVAPSLLSLLSLNERDFAERFAGSPIARIKRPRLVRNACVAAGNWGDETAVPALILLLSDPEPLVRGHAAWALGQIGGSAARAALDAALPGEEDEMVREELLGA